MEAELIDWLRQRLPAHPCLKLGIGDDAAVLDLGVRPECVVTVDMLTDQVDFCLGEVDPRRMSHKALGVNLSDLAAMAARPLAVVIALALPRQGALPLAQALYEGMLPLAERFGVAIAGGDTNTWDGPLAISITAIGQITEHGVLRRDGARPGDRILATGAFGGSILGRHLDVQPRVTEALLLASRYPLHAGIDVSDGLSLDVSRLAAASGVGAILDATAIPVSPDAHRMAESQRTGQTPLDHALADGEDFELVFTVAADVADRIMADRPLDIPLSVIGEITAARGLWLREANGVCRVLTPTGYQHESAP